MNTLIANQLPGWEKISKNTVKPIDIIKQHQHGMFYRYTQELFKLRNYTVNNAPIHYKIIDSYIEECKKKINECEKNIFPKVFPNECDVQVHDLKYLKKQVIKNNGVIIGDKIYKNTWIKAYVNLQYISLSMVQKRLPDDISDIIGEYFPDRHTKLAIYVGSYLWYTRSTFDALKTMIVALA